MGTVRNEPERLIVWTRHGSEQALEPDLVGNLIKPAPIDVGN